MSISRTRRMGRHLPPWRSAAGCLSLAALLLGACGDVVENIPPRPAASDDAAVADAAYPSLATVPARPQLGYTLEQRREIARGLVADRANARHAGDTLRADLGRPIEPDTALPLPPLPAVAASPTADPAADLALDYVEEALARDADDGSLGDFLERLERRPPASAEARPSPPPPEPADPPVPPLSAPAAVPEGPAPSTPGAREPGSPPLPAITADPAAPPDPPTVASAAAAVADTAAVEAVEPLTLPLIVVFDPGAVQIADEPRAQLEQAAQQWRGNGMTIVVTGGGARAGIAMERARRVAALLVSAGVSPGRIAIEMGDERDAVVVYEAGA